MYNHYEINSFMMKFPIIPVLPILPILQVFQVLLNLNIKYAKLNVNNVTDITDIPCNSKFETKSFMAMFPMLRILLIFHVLII